MKFSIQHLSKTQQILIAIMLGATCKFLLGDQLDQVRERMGDAGVIGVIVLIFAIGVAFVFRITTGVIEETTEVLKERTKLAGGFLQAFGTAFPDMVLGIVAAFLSLEARSTDYIRSINYAIIAASTTFGSNIYNIAHAAWCVYRQNLADAASKAVLMFPRLRQGGQLTPIRDHKTKPTSKEMDNAISILTALTWLTAAVAIAMVVFGRVDLTEFGQRTDVYQLIRPAGLVILVLCIWALYAFRKSEGEALEQHARIADAKSQAEDEGENFYTKKSSPVIWGHLIASGLAILLTAESMVRGIETFSHITHIPFVFTGILAGLVGCLGEMIVVHNFSINPRGRVGDAIVGVAMDNIVTTLGASIVAVLGGIFLGGNSLIIIFIVILAANTLLIQQITRLKNTIAATKK